MPGEKSLDSDEYYAHPRNAFWPIMLAIASGYPAPVVGLPRPSYAQRVALITAAGFGVWDVLAQCERAGSLDSAIVRGTEKANDIAGLARKRPELRCIGFNGKAAERLFRRHVLPNAEGSLSSLRLVSLPSTSPAHAALSIEQKFERWAEALAL